MIINKIRLQEEHPMATASLSWPLPFCDLNLDSSAGENGYLIKASQGLDPPNLISVVEGFDSAGVPIMGIVAEKRELAFRIALKPKLGQTFGYLRDELYKFMSRSLLVSLMSDSLTYAQATGYISKFEAVQFSKEPEVQITISCRTGEFFSPISVDIPLVTLDTLNPIINYEDGTAPTGVLLQIVCNAGHSGFSISNHAKTWYEGPNPVNNVFFVDYTFMAGDSVIISTQPEIKGITVVRSGVAYDLAGYINAGAVWPRLYSGVNPLTWNFASSWMTWVSASYIPRFWGV